MPPLNWSIHSLQCTDWTMPSLGWIESSDWCIQLNQVTNAFSSGIKLLNDAFAGIKWLTPSNGIIWSQSITTHMLTSLGLGSNLHTLEGAWDDSWGWPCSEGTCPEIVPRQPPTGHHQYGFPVVWLNYTDSSQSVNIPLNQAISPQWQRTWWGSV